MKPRFFAALAIGAGALIVAPTWQSDSPGDGAVFFGQIEWTPSAQAQSKKRRNADDRRDRRDDRYDDRSDRRDDRYDDRNDRRDDRRDWIEDEIDEQQRENRQQARRVARRTSRRVSRRHDYYTQLPSGCTNVVMNGYPYFYCGGVYYQSALNEDDVTVYVIVNP